MSRKLAIFREQLLFLRTQFLQTRCWYQCYVSEEIGTYAEIDLIALEGKHRGSMAKVRVAGD